MGYEAPTADIAFALAHVVDLPGLLALEPFAHVDEAAVHSAVEEAGRFMAEVVAPLLPVGDRTPARRTPDGDVVMPPGFQEAYRRFVAAGWQSVSVPQAHGGGGAPWLVGVVVQELMAGASVAFQLCPMLTQSAIELLIHHGTDEQRATYLSHLVTGEWTGTMNLTEPQAGSDVGAVRARAIPDGAGTYRLSGQKIFITYGEHDLAEQIVHVVLARTPGAPEGVKGISCFLVPKRRVGADGTPGEANGVRCIGLEHKLGIHASPTCTLDYDEAEAWLVGQEHDGMRAMFTMMNTARLSVGLEGLGVAEAALQRATAYARQRLQGRRGGGVDEQAPIVEHPDVRRMLATMAARTQAMRGIAYLTAEAIDLARHHPDAGRRAAAELRADLLTPIAKAWCTDGGEEVASLGVQVHGGMGYIEETGAAQLLRDVRITSIYEGTNGIQAIDLVGRKLRMAEGAGVASLLADVAEAGHRLAEVAALAELAGGYESALAAARAATDHLAALPARSDDVLAAATPYLDLMGLVVGAMVMARTAVAAAASDDGARLATARFYLQQILPRVHGLLPQITAGATDLPSFT